VKIKRVNLSVKAVDDSVGGYLASVKFMVVFSEKFMVLFLKKMKFMIVFIQNP